MVIVRDAVPFEELKRMATGMFGDMVKAVVDIDRQLMAVGAELHADFGSVAAGGWLGAEESLG